MLIIRYVRWDYSLLLNPYDPSTSLRSLNASFHRLSTQDLTNSKKGPELWKKNFIDQTPKSKGYVTSNSKGSQCFLRVESKFVIMNWSYEWPLLQCQQQPQQQQQQQQQQQHNILYFFKTLDRDFHSQGLLHSIA